jgi:hypothetical protein
VINNPEIGQYFSIGKNVVVVHNNAVYRVHEEDKYYDIVPRLFSIRQNYPNPFNSSTTIRLTMYRSARVNISIYNILGEKLTVLYDNYLEKGDHEIEWNADRFASGLYVYRIQSASSSATLKMMLLK